MKTLLLNTLLILLSFSLQAQSLRINEYSNGTAGAKEWVELVVVNTSPTPPGANSCYTWTFNAAGWVIDDNNGAFSPAGHYLGSGIATGHLRFKNTLPWTNLPLGAIIVIYNNLDKEAVFPADDPFDTNEDCIFVLPASHTSLEYCTNAPQALTCDSVNTYSDCINYTTGNWSNIGLSNTGDGMQLRDPSYNQVHGLSYGKTSSNCTGTQDMIGTSVAPLIDNLTGTNKAYVYNGTDVAGYTNVANWASIAASSATPGAYNNANNQTLIENVIRNGCICTRILALDTTTFPRPIAGQRPAFKAYNVANTLLLESSKVYRTQISIFTLDGRLVKSNKVVVNGRATYSIPEGVYFIHINAEDNSGNVYMKTIKKF